MTYSIAALRLNASMSAVCFSTKELPTERTSIPSVVEPTWIINMYMYVYIYIYTRTHTHAHTQTVVEPTWIIYMYTYMYIYTHTHPPTHSPPP